MSWRGQGYHLYQRTKQKIQRKNRQELLEVYNRNQTKSRARNCHLKCFILPYSLFCFVYSNAICISIKCNIYYLECMLKEIALNRVCLAAYSKRLPMQRWAIPDNQRSPSVRVSVWMDHDKKTFHGDWWVRAGFQNELYLVQITSYIVSRLYSIVCTV